MKSQSKFIHFLVIILSVSITKVCLGQQSSVIVNTIAGTGKEGCKDGIASKATFRYPAGVAIDDSGNVYVSDIGNRKIRKITPQGIVSTIAGSGKQGYENGSALEASFYYPNSLAFDRNGNLIICDYRKIRMLDKQNQLTTIAGNGDKDFFLDGNGGSAGMDNSQGIAIDSNNNIYVADYRDGLIRKVSPNGIVSTFGTIPGKVVDVHSDNNLHISIILQEWPLIVKGICMFQKHIKIGYLRFHP